MKPTRHLQASRIVIPTPTTNPITLTEAKANLRVEHTDEDSFIEGLIDYATGHCEDYTRRALRNQTRKYQVYEFPTIGETYWKFFGCPIKSVTSITYRTDDMAEDDTAITIEATKYRLDNITEPARIIPLEGFPQCEINNFGALITMEHGYESVAVIPGPIKQAIHLIVGHFYENREDSVDKLPKASERLLNPFRVFEY